MFEYLKNIYDVLIRITDVAVDKFSPIAAVAFMLGIYITLATAFIGLMGFMVAPFVATLAPQIIVDGWSLIMPVNTIPCLTAIFTAKVVSLLFRYKTLISNYIASKTAFWK